MKWNGWMKSPRSVLIAAAPCGTKVEREASPISEVLSFFGNIHQLFTVEQSNMPLTFSEDYIAQKLKEATPLNGAVVQTAFLKWNSTQDTRLRCAAVLVPLVWHEREWHLLFTRRTDTVESHKGQVSFPGGSCDEGETTPEQTALREAEEEIGLRPSDVKILGKLTNLITITYFRVTPVVGVVKWPAVFRVGEHEVARVFTIPLGWLSNPSNRWQFERPGTRPESDRLSSL